ncbi:hypothetical protein DMUE_4057, partial [Dictyocoela muelleri]
RRDCSGRIRTDLTCDNIIKFVDHYHEKELKRLVQLNLNKKLKDNALNTNDKFIDAFTKEILEFNDNDKDKVGNYESMRDYHTRLRLKKLHIGEFCITKLLDIYKFTFEGRKFLYHECLETDNNRFHIFITSKNISILEKSEVWLADGTF